MIGRKGNRDEHGNSPVFVSLFDMNNPHKTTKLPKKTIDFSKIHKIIISDLKVQYLIEGSDFLINDLSEIEVDEKEKGHLYISGKQKK
ncbi:MAG: hypothetical protein ACTSQY_04780 [Candidatus Odinarchaeia archaeon]